MSGQAPPTFASWYHKASTSRFSIWISNLIKRVFDVIVSGLGLLFLLPFFAVIGFLIKRDSAGPVFFRGPRMGKGGKIFHILKFRTMHESPESYQGPRVTAQDDPRVTPLGRWLRDTKLNELPQLWNVLKGDMSLVGPRPEDPEIVETWSEEVRSEILSVCPGITSPASVLYRDEENLLKTEQVMSTYLDSILPSKMRLDQLYVRHRSFWLDLDILFWTFLVLLPRLGTYSPPEELLFLGPVSQFIRRYVSWFTIDAIVTLLAIGIVGVFWRTFGPLDVGWLRAFGIAVGFALIFSFAGAVFGVNRIAWSHTGAMDALDLIPAMGVATLTAFAINWFWKPEPLLPPALILMSSAVAFIGFVLVRYRSRFIGGLVSRWLALRGGAMEVRERVLIIGGGEAGQFMAWLLHSSRSAGVFRAIGIIDDDLYKQGTRIQGIRVLGRRTDIPQLVAQQDIGIIVFAIHNISMKERKQLLDICSETPARVVMMPDILGFLNSLVQYDQVDNIPDFQSPKNEAVCPYCFSHIATDHLDAWLTELQNELHSGNLSTVDEKIQSLRDELQASPLLSWQVERD